MNKFEIGESVRLLFDVVSDGTVYGIGRGEALLPAGSAGYVKGCGTFLQDEIIYDVHFLEADRIVGCREKELISGKLPWSPPLFKKGDRVRAKASLTIKGEICAVEGTEGNTGPTLYREGIGYIHEVRFDGSDQLCLVTEEQIERVEF